LLKLIPQRAHTEGKKPDQRQKSAIRNPTKGVLDNERTGRGAPTSPPRQ